MDEVINEPEAFQTDVFGQQENDLFLAQFADDHGVPVPADLSRFFRWTDLVGDWYEHPERYLTGATDELEDAMSDAGWVVVWDAGCFIYDAENAPAEEED